MCLWCTSQVVSKEHSAEARGEWAREGGGVTSTGQRSDQYWLRRGAVLVTNAYQYWSMQ